MPNKIAYRVFVAERNKDKSMGDERLLKELDTHAEATKFVKFAKEAERKTGYYRIVAHKAKKGQ
jgi:hypothetical protein